MQFSSMGHILLYLFLHSRLSSKFRVMGYIYRCYELIAKFERDANQLRLWVYILKKTLCKLQGVSFQDVLSSLVKCNRKFTVRFNVQLLGDRLQPYMDFTYLTANKCSELIMLVCHRVHIVHDWSNEHCRQFQDITGSPRQQHMNIV